jgi:hypothetical protein
MDHDHGHDHGHKKAIKAIQKPKKRVHDLSKVGSLGLREAGSLGEWALGMLSGLWAC